MRTIRANNKSVIMSSRVKLTITCIHEEKIKFDDLSWENNYKYRFIVSSNWIDRRFEFENFDLRSIQ